MLLELCGRSMFDLLREAYLIPKKFHGKAGENPVLLTDVDGNLLPGKSRRFQGESTRSSEILISYMSVHPVQKYIWQMDMI